MSVVTDSAVPQRRPEDDVLDANEEFYAALQARDLIAMDRIWLHQDWVFCVHPGWKGTTGWDAIRRTWEGIFSSSQDLKIQLQQVTLQLCGPIAWMTCIEAITARGASGASASLAQATNIFMRVDGQWKLVHHHASPVPVVGNVAGSGTVQ